MAQEDEQDAFKPMDEQTLLEVGSDSQGTATNSPDEPPPLDIKFGQVHVSRELGKGGMGKVYKGQHLGLDVPVAVKTMSPALAADEHGRQRFLREARTAAKLDHPNIVRVLDVNEHEGTPYIVMEYVDGTDLSALLKKHGPLQGQAALKVIAQVADGLAHAHNQGIVHRDIKPHNIFVSKDGRVKLGDFGLARAVEQTTELTMPGAAIGTAHYMSPEQSNGKDIDQRSDVYSLGVTAYNLITGAPPYTGTTPVSIAVQHVNNDVPYDREKFGHIPDAAVYLFISMTARDANSRPTAEAVHDQLVQIAGGSRLSSLEDLLDHGSVSQYVPVAPTPAPPAQTPQWTQGHANTPAAFGTHPSHAGQFQGSTSNSNTLLWVALGIAAFLLLSMVGCVMMAAAA